MAALLTIGDGKETVMGMGWEQYGQPLGYSQAQWDALAQSVKDDIKRRAGAFTTYADVTARPEMAPVSATPMDPIMDDGSGSGSTSYGTTGTQRVLAESPEWLAYLNALNMEEQQFRADIDKSRALYQSDAERQKQDLVPVYGQSRSGIAGSLESRGMARSGELLRRLAQNRAQEGRQRSGIDASLAGQNLGLEQQLAQKILSLGTQRADREMSMRAQGFV